MKQLRDALDFRAVTPAPRSARALRSALGGGSGESMASLLRMAGPFMPARDAYSFSNSAEGFTLEDAAAVRAIYQGPLDAVAKVGIEVVRSALTAASFAVPIVGATGLPGAAVDVVIEQVSQPLRNALVDAVVGSVPGTYGRCGGFAFSAYDFFLCGWQIDKTDVSPPGSGDLRDFIWKRLLDSLQDNAATFLDWYMTLKVLPIVSASASGILAAGAGGTIAGPLGAFLAGLIGASGDFLGIGGGPALLGRTRDHLDQLAGKLATNAAWPIGIIHPDKDLTDQHQVLAIGPDRSGEHPVLRVWDENWNDEDSGPCCHRWVLDLTGATLQVSCDAVPAYGDIKGLICESYTPTLPPASLDIPLLRPPHVPWSPTDCG
jgi:hypothetical protein